MALISNGDQVLTKNVYNTDETLLWEGPLSGMTPSGNVDNNVTLTESIDNFSKFDIYYWTYRNTTNSSFSVETVVKNPSNNTLYFLIPPWPEDSSNGAWYKQSLSAVGTDVHFDGGYTSNTSAARMPAKNSDGRHMWGHGNIYKIVGINRKQTATQEGV